MIVRRPKKSFGEPRARSGRSQSSVRRDIVALHREIFRRNQVRISQSVLGYTPAFRRYEREYAQGVKSFDRHASLEELDRTVAESTTVYVGDYHTLAQAQRAFLRLVRRLPEDRPVILALEYVLGKHQKSLDDFLAGRLSEKSFRKLVDGDEHWEFGGWHNFQELFEIAKRRGYRVVGIDAMGRGPAGATLQARDLYAARILARERRHQPDALTMVLIGELHIAPAHLPRAVQESLGEAFAERPLILYQNCEEIYWQLEEKGLEHETELVRVDDQSYCLLNTPPIVCQQSFLNWLDVDEGMPELTAPEQNFKEYARLVASFFDLPLGDALDEVELATVVDLSFLARLKRRGDFSAEDMRQIKKQILRSESYYIPRAKMAYLGNLSVNHASEEATHFVRHICSGSPEPRGLVDAFYARCLEEAIGFLGSKLVNHKRKCAHLPHFERLLRSKVTPREERSLAKLVLLHAQMERGQRPRGLARIYETSADLFNAVTHVLGYRLGDKLYYALVRGQMTKDEIRALFFDPWDEEGEALTTFLYLTMRTRDVVVPERF